MKYFHPAVQRLNRARLTLVIRRHGTWRPQLQKLAASNSEALVKSLTLEASAQLSTKPKPSSQADVRRALDTVAKLKGVGPATASLLLSCFRPDCVPFFSDELYRWLCFGDAPTKGTSGWRRTIGYTFKEYYVLIERARDLVERLKEESEGGDLDMLKLEKVAYVLGKEKADMDASDRDAEDSGDEVTETASEQSDAPPVKPKKVSGTKRSRAAESSTDQKEVASKKARPTRTLSRKK